jgi:uncharacterized membrane protein HdeD (DUF308 family)
MDSVSSVSTSSAMLSPEISEETTRRDLWWVDLIRGIVFTILGIAIVFWPLSTLAALVWIAGVFTIAVGIIDIVRGIFTIGRNWAWVGSILLGILAIVVGVIVLRYPAFSLATYLYLLAFYFLISGAVSLFAPQDNPAVRGPAVVYGVLSIILGVLLLFNPVGGGLTFYWVSGVFALIAGPTLIAFSFRSKRARHAQDSEMLYTAERGTASRPYGRPA